MDGRTENLPILQDFVPYRGRCPASIKIAKERNQEKTVGQGKGTADHLMPLGDWFLYFFLKVGLYGSKNLHISSVIHEANGIVRMNKVNITSLGMWACGLWLRDMGMREREMRRLWVMRRIWGVSRAKNAPFYTLYDWILPVPNQMSPSTRCLIPSIL